MSYANTQQKINLEQFMEYIFRDSAIWRGVSLLYVQWEDKTTAHSLEHTIKDFTKNNPGALLFEENRNYIVLGAKSAPEFNNSQYACFWAGDLEKEWRSACGALNKFHVKKPAFQGMPSLNSERSILIVEDEPLLNKIMSKHISKFGTVITTSNYREAIANYMVDRPELVFLDIHYQNDERDGFDILKNLLIADSNAFIVMVSGDGKLETKINALKWGAQGL